MGSVNKVLLVGRLGKDPELKDGANTQICKFSLATDSGWGEKKETDWHNVTAFGRTAETAGQYLSKGSLCAIEGRVSYSRWEKEDGTVSYFTNIIADRVTFLGGKSDSQSAPSGGFDSGDSNNDSDIPF